MNRYPLDGRHDRSASVVHGRAAGSCQSNTTPAGGGQRVRVHGAIVPHCLFAACQRRSNSLGVR